MYERLCVCVCKENEMCKAFTCIIYSCWVKETSNALATRKREIGMSRQLMCIKNLKKFEEMLLEEPRLEKRVVVKCWVELCIVEDYVLMGKILQASKIISKHIKVLPTRKTTTLIFTQLISYLL